MSNCSILEALQTIEDLTKSKIKKKYLSKNRVGDHIWYVSNIEKFKKHYPQWTQKYNTANIIEELVESLK